MRLIIIVLALCAAWYYYVNTKTNSGVRYAESIERTAVGFWLALPISWSKADQDLRNERQRSANLVTELLGLREALARASAEAVTREKALQNAQVALKTHDERETANVAHAEALGSQLAATRQDAALRTETLQRTIGEGEAQIAELSHNNGLLNQRLNDATAQIEADNKARASLEGELRAALEGSQQQQEQSHSLASDLDRLRETSSSRIADLQGQLEKARAEATSKAGATSTPQDEPMPDASRIVAPTQVANDGAAAIVPEPLPRLARNALVEGIRTRVVVRFSSNNASAEAHAVKICSVLQAQGIIIEQIVGSPSTLPADSLAYFYRTDESRAAIIATLFPEFRSTMRQRPLEDRIPRPGLIEIEVAA